MTKTIIYYIAGIVATILLIDFVGFWLWILSGQNPADNWYIGRITTEVLRFFINLIK
jgi:hypothetical protein